MIAFHISDMTCGHCAATITKALNAADPGAAVHIDLAAQQVMIEPALAGVEALASAIAEAGYTPMEQPMDGAAAPVQ